jgi:hypothetical protein
MGFTGAIMALVGSIFLWLGLAMQIPLLIVKLPTVQQKLKGPYHFGVVSRIMAAAACVLLGCDVTGSRFPLSEEGEPLRLRIRLVLLCLGVVALWFYLRRDVLLEWTELVRELLTMSPRPRLVWPKDLEKMRILEWTNKGTSLSLKHRVSKH